MSGAAAASFYNGPANCCESGPRLAVDADGNVYVAGTGVSTRGANFNSDIYVDKYDAQGTQQRGRGRLLARRDGRGVPDWLQVTFAGAKSISEVDVFSVRDNYANPIEPGDAPTFSRYGLVSLEVQYWDGSDWRTAPGGTVSGNNRVKCTITFPAVTSERVRVLVHYGLAGYTRITEVEAF